MNLKHSEFPFSTLEMSQDLRKILRVGLIQINHFLYLIATVPIISLQKFPIFKVFSTPQLSEDR